MAEIKIWQRIRMSDWQMQSFSRRSLITVALKKIKAHPEHRKAINEALEIERFFRSGWYSQLTSVDGNTWSRGFRMK